MRIVLGGRLENALIREFDAVVRPDRNSSGHPYYVQLNRKLPRAYFERVGTFTALAERTLIPSVDWTDQGDARLDGRALGLAMTDDGGREWDEDSRAFARLLLSGTLLSEEQRLRLGAIDLTQFDAETRARIQADPELAGRKRDIAVHALCRLFLQLRAARQGRSFLVLAADDLALLEEIVRLVLSHRLPTPFDLPDLTGRLLPGEDFAAGLLNFAPPDAAALVAVRRDRLVRDYAFEVRRALRKAEREAAEEGLLQAMAETHAAAGKAAWAANAFEISSWICKPLHYIPVLGEVLSVAEDVRDVAAAWVGRRRTTRSWHLIAARMTEVAVEDYLARMGNRLRR